MTVTRQPSGSRGDLVYEHVLAFMVEHDLGPGDILPTENELSRMTGVSRPIVREALMRLHAEGLIVSRRGARSHLLQRPSERQVHYLRPVGVRAWLDALEVRIAVEPAAARLAAQHRSADALQELRVSCRADIEAAGAGDLRFHRAVATASLNTMFPAILDALDAQVGGLMVPSAVPAEFANTEPASFEAEHFAILTAIENGDAETAEAAMRIHLLAERKRARRKHQRS